MANNYILFTYPIRIIVLKNRHSLKPLFHRVKTDLFHSATQLPINAWHDNIKDPTIADAILDRLIHNAHKITLKGDSMRKIRSRLTKEINSEK